MRGRQRTDNYSRLMTSIVKQCVESAPCIMSLFDSPSTVVSIWPLHSQRYFWLWERGSVEAESHYGPWTFLFSR